MTGPPQSDSRHGNQDQRGAHKARVLTKPERQDGALSPAASGWSPFTSVRPAGSLLRAVRRQTMGTPGAASPACPDGAPKPGFALRSSPSPPSSRGRRQDSSSAAFALKVGDASQRVQNHKAQKENKEKTLQNMALPETAQGSAPGAASRLHSTGGKGKYKRSGGEGARPARLCHAQRSGPP